MLFVPVKVTVTAGDQEGTLYDSGIGVFGKKLRAFELAGDDMTAPLSAIGGDLQVNVVGAFATQGAWNGFGGWEELSERYGAWKESKVPGTPILVGIRPVNKGTREHPTRPQTYVESGAMRKEMSDPLIYRVTPRSMLFAPEGDYYGYHLTGTDKMPPRPQIELSVETLHLWDGFWVQWLNDLVKDFEL